MNTSLDENFNTAITLAEKSFSHEELFALLNSEKIVEKHFAVLKIEQLNSQKEADIFVSNLTGQDGKVREVVAIKLNEFILKYPQYFNKTEIFETMLEGLMDINGNVCRQIISLIGFEPFKNYLKENLPQKTREVIKTAQSLRNEHRQYVISKRNFQLYWCLEALNYVTDEQNINQISDIIEETANFEDYTIREKTATLIKDKSGFDKIKTKFKNDENYYVRTIISNESSD